MLAFSEGSEFQEAKTSLVSSQGGLPSDGDKELRESKSDLAAASTLLEEGGCGFNKWKWAKQLRRKDKVLQGLMMFASCYS